MNSWNVIMEILEEEGPLTPSDIMQRTDLAPRTVNFALRKLLELDMVTKIPNLRDMRSPLYYVKEVIK